MIGKNVLHYRIIEKLGQGGMGIVYKAHDTKLNRAVAVKFLPQMGVASESERKRFQNEAQAVAALNHSNISQIYAIEETDEHVFIVMEFIDGRELKELVNQQQPIPIDDVVNYSIQIAEGLAAAHNKGIVHRDIKSSNIMITTDNKVKIMDFGLAKLSGNSQITIQGTTLGTIAYMSPEQSIGRDVDQRTDIWSFGVLLYELLANDFPFKGDYDQAVIYSILNEPPTDISGISDDVPAVLKGIIDKCLQKNPEDRFQTMDEIYFQLGTFKQDQSNDVPRESIESTQDTSESRMHATVSSGFFKKGLMLFIPVMLLISIYYLFVTGDPSVALSSTENSKEIITDKITSPSALISSLMQIKETETFIKELDIYKKSMQIAVGNSKDFKSKEGCYIFVVDKENVKAVYRYENNSFNDIVREVKISDLKQYKGYTAIWLKDYSE